MQKKAMTLVEMALSLAVVGLLAVGVTPRMRDGDIAAKVAQAQTDLRAIGVALEAYRANWPKYPPDSTGYTFGGLPGPSPATPLYRLTTPVAYMQAIPDEQFPTTGTWASDSGRYNRYYAQDWINIMQSFGNPNLHGRTISTDQWALVSNGPDCRTNTGEYLLFGEDILNSIAGNPTFGTGPGCLYDVTNGSLSFGDIVWMKNMPEPPQPAKARNWQGY